MVTSASKHHQDPAATGRVLEAGAVQGREWMLSKIRPDGYPFNLGLRIETGTFNHLTAQKTLDLLVERHEILRTTLRPMEGRLMQVIHAPGEYKSSFDFHDIVSLSDEAKLAFVKTAIGESIDLAFDFETGPLFRIKVIKISSTWYIIYLVFHHMIADLHSLSLLQDDIREIYNTTDKVKSLAGERIQYRRFSAELNELLNTPKGDKYRKFWKGCLERGIPMLDIIPKHRQEEYEKIYRRRAEEVKSKVFDLPYYDERFLGTAIRRYCLDTAGDMRYIFPREVFLKLTRYIGTGRHGLFALLAGSLLQAFKALSGQTDYVFEMPVLNRPSPAYNQTAGWLATGGLCRFDVSGDRTPGELLEHVDEQLYYMSRYSLYPYEAVFPGLTPAMGSRVPVFLSLSYLKQDTGISDEGIVFERSSGSGTYQDMALFFTFFNDLAVLDLAYNNLLFTAGEVHAILDAHLAFLDAFLSSESTY